MSFFSPASAKGMNVSMRPTISLPPELAQRLAESGIAQEAVLRSALSDMTTDCRYALCYVLLTSEKLVLANAAPDPREVQVFGGNAASNIDKKKREWTVKIFPVAEIDQLEIQRLVTGGVLFSTADGSDRRLTAFSNTRMGEFRRLTEIFRKLKEGRELTDEDFKDDREPEYCPKCGAMYPERGRRICPKCMDKRSVFFRTLAYFKPHAPKIAVMILCYLGTAGLNLIWPYLNGTVLYDKVLRKNEAFLNLAGLPAGRFGLLLGGVVLTMVLTKLVIQALGMVQGVVTARVVPDVVKNIKSSVFDSMGRLSINFYNSRQTGGLMVRVLDDANNVTGFFMDGLPYFFINLLTILSTCGVMLAINWRLAVASLVLLPALTFISSRLMPRLWHFYGKRHRAFRTMNAQINDNLTGARVVKAFGQEDTETIRFENYNGRVRDAELSLVGYDNRFYSLYSAVQNLSTFMIWGVGSALVLSGTGMELGVLLTFVGYISQLNGPLDFMSHIFRQWAESINSAQRIFEIIDAVPEVEESSHPVPVPHMRGEVVLENVTFGYEPNQPVLQGISFTAEAGKMLGIVGRSGAGKSTLVNLISRLYDPEEGRITIDGIDVRDMSFADLRRNVAMVSQETYIFMGTVAQNIAYARPDASREEIMAAAISASAHDFICKMPDGYDTMIGSSGRNLSGGERQRISIARAILANPRILILDEATASVDTETERAIQSSLDRLVKGRTTISIAHRLSTLKNADRLVVIDGGRLTESGTHAELIAGKGTYHKLMQLQTKALAMRGLE